jgi:tetratricopeptide (TPR) repeat protein
VACCQRMLAWQQLGELRRALDEFEELRVDGSASAQTTLAAIRAMAGALHGLIGTAEEGERLLRSARELNVQANNLSAAATNAFSIARLAARNNDYARAIEILKNEREGVYALSDPTLVEKFERMLDDYQRGCGRKESAMPLTIGLREPLRKARLTAGDIPHLRSIVASSDDLLLLARFALGSGLPKEARELTLEASLSFGELRDTCGIADCLSLLADIAQMQRQWEKAFEFSQMAAAACSRIGDQMREVASLAVLAFCLYKLEKFGEAGNVAERCLLRAEGQAVSRPVLIASFVGAAACDKNGDLSGKFRLVTCFLRAYPLAQGVDDLAPLRDSFQRMLKPAATST